MSERSISLSIKEISRIEGHLNVDVVVDENGDVKAYAKALEGTRIVENVLVGNDYWEAIEIASRMCGVCHAIHKLTATQAMENAFNVIVPEDAAMFRDIICIAGHIQSHLTHLYYFALPDFYGKNNILELLNEKKELVLKIIKLRQLTVDVIKRIGGSPVHPITPVVGGLSKEFNKSDVKFITEKFREMRGLVMEVAETMLGLDLPNFSRKTQYVALRDNKSIPLLRGDINLLDVRDYSSDEFLNAIQKILEKYSNAPHFLLNSESYMVGALSRLNINYPYLISEAKDICKRYNIKFPNYNPFVNNFAQALEIIHYTYEALDILENLASRNHYKHKTNFKVKKGMGISASEAPRGLLIHKYSVDENGRVVEANIITPTAQNLKNLERDCVAYFKLISNEPPDVIEKKIEMLVRSYDPCISCASRFRKL